MHWLTAYLKRRLVRVSSATLVNILTKTQAVPEFLLEECTTDNIYASVKKLMENPADRNAQLAVSALAIKMLGKNDDAMENKAATSVLNFIKS